MLTKIAVNKHLHVHHDIHCSQVDYNFAGASWFFNIFDMDGSIVRHAQPSKPAGPYWIGSYPDWWNLGPDSWKEPMFKGKPAALMTN